MAWQWIPEERDSRPPEYEIPESRSNEGPLSKIAAAAIGIVGLFLLGKMLLQEETPAPHQQ
jgi:hypothetical protein